MPTDISNIAFILKDQLFLKMRIEQYFIFFLMFPKTNDYIRRSILRTVFLIVEMGGASEPKAEPVTVAEIKDIAETRLPKPVWRYYVDGADDQVTTRRNAAVFNE